MKSTRARWLGLRYIRWLVFVGLLLLGTFGCRHLPVCKNKQLQTNERTLRGLWNALRHMNENERKMLQQWSARFLDHLLGGTPFQLKDNGQTFVVVDPSNVDRPCRINVRPQQQQVRDSKFLARLYQLQQKNQLTFASYMYNAPQEYTASGVKAVVTGGNCNSRDYLVEFSYWKSISSKYSHSTWPEACKLGIKLKKWDSCFPPGYQKIYRERMKKICR